MAAVQRQNAAGEAAAGREGKGKEEKVELVKRCYAKDSWDLRIPDGLSSSH